MTTEIVNGSNLSLRNAISWMFGVLFFGIGVINTFWGNDPGFGVFVVLLSIVYFLPVKAIAKEKMNISIPRIGLLRVLLGAFILWAALGVGELFDKIELMKASL